MKDHEKEKLSSKWGQHNTDLTWQNETVVIVFQSQTWMMKHQRRSREAVLAKWLKTGCG